MGAERWPALLSRAEAAEYLGVSETTISREKAGGRLHSVTIRGLIKYRRSELDSYIESLPYGDGTCPANDFRDAQVAIRKRKQKSQSA